MYNTDIYFMVHVHNKADAELTYSVMVSREDVASS